MSLTRRIHKGGMKTKGKKGKGHCNKGGKTMKKGGRNVLVPLAFLTAVLANGKSKNPRKSRKSRKSRKGGSGFTDFSSHPYVTEGVRGDVSVDERAASFPCCKRDSAGHCRC